MIKIRLTNDQVEELTEKGYLLLNNYLLTYDREEDSIITSKLVNEKIEIALYQEEFSFKENIYE